MAYMGLETINLSDYVSPEPINRNFAKLDPLGLDYVISRGTSGDWWFRKWKSGRLECGVDFRDFGDQAAVNWHGWFATKNYLNFGAYPQAFRSKPFVMITYMGDARNSNRSSFVFQRANTSTTRSPDFYLCDVTNATWRPYCGIYVCGNV
ncbi:MAG: hypothetical protein [Chaetfec virus UA24_144]|nr:MAG: hypothetical protein [Chaetfec virus UA24_144]